MSPLSPGRGYSPVRNTLIATSGPTAKLEHVTERFATMWSDLEQEKQSRKLAENSRAQMLQDSITRLEKSLEAEVKRRAESDKQLQSHFEGEIRSLAERQAQQYSEMQGSLRAGVESLTARVSDLHQVVKEEREQRRNDIEHLATNLVGKVNECVAALDDERNSRVQEQHLGLKRVGEDLLGLQQKVDVERIARETEVSSLRQEVHDVLGNRNTSDDQFKTAVWEEVTGLKAGLELEREERVAEDDEIVQAINDYTKALQDGLKIVSH
ncbi:MAG: hypothetical protein WDW36_004194 [Sanguina aurantia]